MGEAVLDSYCPDHEELQLTPSVSRKVIKFVRKLGLGQILEGVLRSNGAVNVKTFGSLNREFIEPPRTISRHGKDHGGRSPA